MRLPVVPQISTKDGLSNKNARLTNCLKEVSKTSEKAVVRPGMSLDAQASGVGHGLVVFNNELVSVYGTTLGLNTAAAEESSLSVITDTIASACLTTFARNIGGTIWLFSAENTDLEEVQLYSYDSSDDSTTLLVPGVTLAQVTGIATNGSKVVISYRDFGEGYSGQALAVADVGVLTFTEVAGLTGVDPFAVKYGGGKFVSISTGIGSCYIHWSSDGVTWNEDSIPTGNGREVLFDGTSWWFFCGNGTADMVVYKTTDFVTFSLQTITGLPSLTSPTYCAYANGTYYLIGNFLYTSSDGLVWTATATVMSVVVQGTDGEIYGARAATDRLYSVDGVTVTEITSTSFTGGYRVIDSNDDGSIIIGPTYSASVVRVDVSDGVQTIPALTTITGDYYDFAQSPI